MREKKKREIRAVADIPIRYILLLILPIKNLFIFYFIFTPLTVYPVYFLLNLFYNATLSGINITINNHTIELIEACIAGAAYYLLLILNLTTKMPWKKRINLILYSFAVLLFLNILRIFVLSILFINNFVYFDIIHKFFWYLLSIIFVVGIWFSGVKIFRIKNIPVYSDMRLLISRSKL